MEIDVFTLFPEAFSWFERQRHVTNALAHGNTLSYVNYRDHTPLNAGQVDDTPFGGGAGMVLRVGVVEAALRARYQRDPVQVRDERRVIAPTGVDTIVHNQIVRRHLAQHGALVTNQPQVIVAAFLIGRPCEHETVEKIDPARHIARSNHVPATERRKTRWRG